jgi:hypothetical protein
VRLGDQLVHDRAGGLQRLDLTTDPGDDQSALVLIDDHCREPARGRPRGESEDLNYVLHLKRAVRVGPPALRGEELP